MSEISSQKESLPVSTSLEATESVSLSPETTASGSVSLLYVKRKRTEPSNPSLFVQFSAKRQKVFNEFKFVTSTQSEPKKLDRDELLKKYKHQNTVSDVKDRCRREADLVRKNRKYNLISAARGDEGPLFSAAIQQDEDDIVCNTEKMLSQKLTLNESLPFVSNGAEEWVYDVYLCETSCEGDINSIRSEQLPGEDFEPVKKEKYINEYDDDSNDENYYANEYPDEESSSNSSDSSNELLSAKRYSNDYFDELGLNRTDYLDKYLMSDTDSD